MRRPEIRIRGQITGSVCLFTIVCLVSLAVAIYTLSRHTLLRLERGNLDLNSRMLREECRQDLEDVLDSFIRFASSQTIQDIYAKNTNENTPLGTSLLQESLGPDRILQMRLYDANATEMLAIESKGYSNTSNAIPLSLLPLSNPEVDPTPILDDLESVSGKFIGPVYVPSNVTGSDYLLSLIVPVKILSRKQLLQAAENRKTLGYLTCVVNCYKLQRILSSVSLSSAANEAGSAALCGGVNNVTTLHQLLPFSMNATALYKSDELAKLRFTGTPSFYENTRFSSGIVVPPSQPLTVPKKMAVQLRNLIQPTAEVNKGPQKSMISISPFSIGSSIYYVVVLQSHKGVFAMTHQLRNIIVIASCAIGAGMIIFTFLFVSFGARQILRLKMAATYEEPMPTPWWFLPLPWWLRPVSRKKSLSGSSSSSNPQFHIPETVPLRKHVRDELDDITERFNLMSNELRKQYAILEQRVEERKSEIEQAREAADLANAAKSHFLARVTHELRTPLNGIIGTATLCMEEDDIDEIHQSLRTIFKCGELLLHLMTDLLSFSQNEVENLDLEPRDFGLKEITSQLTAIFTEQCSNKHIRLVVESNPDDDQYVFSGDTNRILQVVFNLMSNGIKFTPSEGEVRFKAEVSDILDKKDYKELTFYVSDNGPGIAPELQPKVFEAFVQGDISSHIKKAGVGLGLSICRQLADRMDGTVTLKSELGKGSTFIFKIPLPYRIKDKDASPKNDPFDHSNGASIYGRSRAGTPSTTPVGSPRDASREAWIRPGELEQQQQQRGGEEDESGSEPASPESGDKSTDSSSKTPAARSKITRTLSATSVRTRGFLSRRKSGEGFFKPMEFLQRRMSSDADAAAAAAANANNTAAAAGGSSGSGGSGSATAAATSATNGGTKSRELVTPERSNPKPEPQVPPLPPKLPVDSEKARKLQRSVGSPTNTKSSGSTTHGRSPSSSKQSPADGSKRAPPPPRLNGDNFEATIPPPPRRTPLTPLTPTVMPDSHTPGSGSIFGPALTISSSAPLGQVSQPDEHQQQQQQQQQQPVPAELRVLVVDDNSVNQEVMTRMLRLEGLQHIAVANDGVEAIDKIKHADAEGKSFDVIFMDVQMPNMDGRQATRVIRNELRKCTPVVAVSAFANDSNASDCIDAGMNLFLPKPLRRPHLRHILQTLPTLTAENSPIEESE